VINHQNAIIYVCVVLAVLMLLFSLGLLLQLHLGVMLVSKRKCVLVLLLAQMIASVTSTVVHCSLCLGAQ
jgi:hypothetical protein